MRFTRLGRPLTGKRQLAGTRRGRGLYAILLNPARRSSIAILLSAGSLARAGLVAATLASRTAAATATTTTAAATALTPLTVTALATIGALGVGT